MKRNKEKQSGVSLISLIITIIVLIIIASVGFGSSSDTITNATFSTYVSGVADVEEAFHTKASNIQGMEAAKGKVYADSQVYDYLAKDGKTASDYLDEIDVPAYTVIVDNNQIGIKMKEMVLPSGKRGNVPMKYAITQNGTVFTWPPFESNGRLYVNSEDTVESRTARTLKVGGETINLGLDLNTNELTDGNISSVSTLVKAGKIKVGDYIDYEKFLTAKTYTASKERTGITEDRTLTTDTTKKWRVIYADVNTGEVWITPEGVINSQELGLNGALGYLNGPKIIDEICKRLYSTDKMTARSMTIADIDKITGHDKTTFSYSGVKYGETKQYTQGDKFIVTENNGISGGSLDGDVPGTTAKYYKATTSSPISVKQLIYWYVPKSYNATVGEILGGTNLNRAWLASSCVVAGENMASFYVNSIYSDSVGGYLGSAYSDGGADQNTFGLRPMISLGASTHIENFADDGEIVGYEWRIAE